MNKLFFGLLLIGLFTDIANINKVQAEEKNKPELICHPTDKKDIYSCWNTIDKNWYTCVKTTDNTYECIQQ